MLEAYQSFKNFKLWISPWLALVGGFVFLGWVINDKRGAVGFGDLYPGLLLFVASGVLFAYVRYVFRDAGEEPDEFPDEDEEADV